MLTVKQAVAQVAESKSTVIRAIRNGKLSATKTDSGYMIDPAELFRVYAKTQDQTQAKTQSGTSDPDQVQALIDAALMKAELEAERKDNSRLETLVGELKQEREDLKEQRDKWAAQAQGLLSDQRKKVRVSWIDRLLSRKAE